jgi:hypothetical protein
MTIDAHWSGDGHLAVSIVEATLPASTETLDLVAQALTARAGRWTTAGSRIPGVSTCRWYCRARRRSPAASPSHWAGS